MRLTPIACGYGSKSKNDMITQRLMVLIYGRTQAAMAADDRTSVMKKGPTEHCYWESVDQICDILKDLDLQLMLPDFQSQGR